MPFTKEQPQEYVTQCSYCSFVLIGEVGGSSLFCVSSFLLLLGGPVFSFHVLQFCRGGGYI